jgi:hypothetical protein
MVGREIVKVVSKSYGTVDNKGNPTEVKTERVIRNVLVAQSGSTINYGLHDTSKEIDIELYLNAREDILSDDEFIYEGRNYQQVGEPTLWKTARGSITKPKLIVRLKSRD